MKKSCFFSTRVVPAVLALLVIAGVCLSGKEVRAEKTPAAAFGVQEYSRPDAAIDFILTDFRGRKVSLREFRGKTVMLNFWATWCGPCIEEMPSMEKLHQQFKDRGLVVLAVAAGEKPQDVKDFMREYQLTFLALVDSNEEVVGAYNVRSIPLTYFINPKGEVVGKIFGGRQWDQEAAIRYVNSLLQNP